MKDMIEKYLQHVNLKELNTVKYTVGRMIR